VKLHRLVLSNYRGIAHREIVLPDSGVVVVSGVNEIGKSSMIEAIDLLLETKDRSTKKEVKQVKQTHADVGAEVTAEISTGPYRFVYRKRFHKKAETELTVLIPRREQLTGDEAHERVCAMLAETVDTELWRAQRVLQAGSTSPVDLSGCDALSRALDVAAGRVEEPSGDESVLVDRIDAEYARYFTQTGRPTGEWAAVTTHLTAAEEKVAGCIAAITEVEDCVTRHGELSGALANVSELRAAARRRLAAAEEAAAAVAEVSAQLAQAEALAAAAEATRAASAIALTERRRLCADVEERDRAATALEDEADKATEDENVAREVHRVAAAATEQSGVALEQAQRRADLARSTFHRLADRAEADGLASRLAQIDAANADLDRADQSIAANLVTDDLMRRIEVAAAAVERAAGLLESVSARIELTAVAHIDVLVDGQLSPLSAGQSRVVCASAPTTIDIPGVLSARVIPGGTASDVKATLDAAESQMSEVLASAAAADLADARGAADRRRDLVCERERLAARLSGLRNGEAVEELRARLGALRADDSSDPIDGANVQSARAELDAAMAAHREAVAQSERDRQVTAAASAKLSEKITRAMVLLDRLAAARAELIAARERLGDRRAVIADDAVASRAQIDECAAMDARARVGELCAQREALAPDHVTVEVQRAEQELAQLSLRHDDLSGQLRDTATQLRLYGSQGRKGELDAAEAAREQAISEHARVGRRARAVQLLRSVMRRHRDEARLRYVEPFRAEVQRLGRIVFGESFEVEVDSALRICSRTLSGRTVPFESLSGGAKEQLGIIARLAGAALVAKKDNVPVIIDDALGFTDDERLQKMGAVFGAVGGEGQVLVLTCSPQRYRHVVGAHHIELAADRGSNALNFAR
jgi:uncharacterized protein YhaN